MSYSHSAQNFALETTRTVLDNFFSIQQRANIERQLQEVADKAGVPVTALKTAIGFLLIGAGGYLLYLNMFGFILPVAIVVLLLAFIGFFAEVRSLSLPDLQMVESDDVLIPQEVEEKRRVE